MVFTPSVSGKALWWYVTGWRHVVKVTYKGGEGSQSCHGLQRPRGAHTCRPAGPPSVELVKHTPVAAKIFTFISIVAVSVLIFIVTVSVLIFVVTVRVIIFIVTVSVVIFIVTVSVIIFIVAVSVLIFIVTVSVLIFIVTISVLIFIVTVSILIFIVTVSVIIFIVTVSVIIFIVAVSFLIFIVTVSILIFIVIARWINQQFLHLFRKALRGFSESRLNSPVSRGGPRWYSGLTTRVPTKANRTRFPAGPPRDYRTWESCRTMPLVGSALSLTALPRFGLPIGGREDSRPLNARRSVLMRVLARSKTGTSTHPRPIYHRGSEILALRDQACGLAGVLPIPLVPLQGTTGAGCRSPPGLPPPAYVVNHYQYESNHNDRTPERTSWWGQPIVPCIQVDLKQGFPYAFKPGTTLKSLPLSWYAAMATSGEFFSRARFACWLNVACGLAVPDPWLLLGRRGPATWAAMVAFACLCEAITWLHTLSLAAKLLSPGVLAQDRCIGVFTTMTSVKCIAQSLHFLLVKDRFRELVARWDAAHVTDDDALRYGAWSVCRELRQAKLVSVCIAVTNVSIASNYCLMPVTPGIRDVLGRKNAVPGWFFFDNASSPGFEFSVVFQAVAAGITVARVTAHDCYFLSLAGLHVAWLRRLGRELRDVFAEPGQPRTDVAASLKAWISRHQDATERMNKVIRRIAMLRRILQRHACGYGSRKRTHNTIYNDTHADEDNVPIHVRKLDISELFRVVESVWPIGIDMEQRRNKGGGGWGEGRSPKKIRRSTASSGTIPTCENPKATRPGFEPGSPWWEGEQSNLYTTTAPTQAERRNFCIGRIGKESAMAFVRNPTQHSPGVITENHGEPKSGWPNQESNPDPPECESRATVAELLPCSPPPRAIRIRSPAGSLRIFACGNRAGRCRCSEGFIGDLPFPPLPFIPALLHTHLSHPTPALKTSMLRAVKISSLIQLISFSMAPSVECIEVSLPGQYISLGISINHCLTMQRIPATSIIGSIPLITGETFQQNCCQISLVWSSVICFYIRRVYKFLLMPIPVQTGQRVLTVGVANEQTIVVRGTREIPEKTRRSAESYGTITTCEKSGVTPPGMGEVFRLGRHYCRGTDDVNAGISRAVRLNLQELYSPMWVVQFLCALLILCFTAFVGIVVRSTTIPGLALARRTRSDGIFFSIPSRKYAGGQLRHFRIFSHEWSKRFILMSRRAAVFSLQPQFTATSRLSRRFCRVASVTPMVSAESLVEARYRREDCTRQFGALPVEAMSELMRISRSPLMLPRFSSETDALTNSKCGERTENLPRWRHRGANPRPPTTSRPPCPRSMKAGQHLLIMMYKYGRASGQPYFHSSGVGWTMRSRRAAGSRPGPSDPAHPLLAHRTWEFFSRSVSLTATTAKKVVRIRDFYSRGRYESLFPWPKVTWLSNPGLLSGLKSMIRVTRSEKTNDFERKIPRWRPLDTGSQSWILRMNIPWPTNIIDFIQSTSRGAVFGAPPVWGAGGSGFESQVSLSLLPLLLLVGYTSGNILQLFLLCYYGDRLQDASELLPKETFAATWYTCGQEVQSSLRLVFQRCNKTLRLSAMGIAPLSLETFEAVRERKPEGRAEFYCVLGLTLYASKGRKSCKEAYITPEKDWAAMTSKWGHDYLPKWPIAKTITRRARENPLRET
ncbi:hypothetical protein PR048_000203 [Dryococelus australis]|uniref:Uncharacterized protein n=1 Tax=Dryococelus australis TaxID=614101 RepID=A0ABQ9IE09_9NEOP|nr:hypothetical protein PR048_000203 [Dryococelus australis]